MTTFTAKRVEHSHTIELNETPETVFPLFTPEGEKKWAEGWDFERVYPTAQDTEENMIFTTLSHDHGQLDAIWIVTRYAPSEFFIEYQRIEPGVKIGRIRVQCQRLASGKTSATIEYMYTALSEQGHQFLDGFTEFSYLHFLLSWEKAINYYLHTGMILNHT